MNELKSKPGFTPAMSVFEACDASVPTVEKPGRFTCDCCAGATTSLDLCWEAVRKEGTVVQVGVYPGSIETDLNKVMMKELRFIGTYGYVWTSWERCLRLLREGKVRTEELISHEFPLDQFEEAFRVTQDGSATKVVLNPQITRWDTPLPKC